VDREAEAAMRAAGLEPLEPYPGFSTPWRCRCQKCGEEVAPRLSTIVIGRGCRYCGNTERRISDEQAATDMRAAGVEPLERYPGVTRRWRCRCLTCGEEVTPSLMSVRQGRGGCRDCGIARRAEAQPIPDVEAAALMRAAGLEPRDPYPGGGEPWRCRCLTCGNEVAPSLQSIKRGHRCRYCSDHGIDWGAPGRVYLLHHETWGAHKVGIASLSSSRLEVHGERGWETYRTLPVDTVEDAFLIEQSVLARFRDAHLCPYLTREQMPQGGYAETVDADAVSLPVLWDEIVAAAAAREAALAIGPA
jgi:DNA-directed RNA polymerase subunit RPC12/RpoP